MIVKRAFSPASVLAYARVELALGAVAGVAAVLLVPVAGLAWLGLPPTLAVVLGTALSILLGFRANSAYQRWWDASSYWAQISAASRNLARIVVTLGDSKKVHPDAAVPAVAAWQARMVRRQVAWTNALRLELRGQSAPDDWTVAVLRHLPSAEHAEVLAAESRASLLLQLQSRDIFACYGAGFLAGFDNFQLEQILPQLAQQQALCERIKTTPIPRPYAIFARTFVDLFVLLLPFTLVSGLATYPWIVIPIGAVFGLVERTAVVTEDPFENRVQDVPLTAICIRIERDVLEQLGESERPAAPTPVAGYLF